METEIHVTDLLPAFALGSLDETEAVAVREHLAVCQDCRNALAPFEAVAGKLALAAPDAEPPVRLKQTIMGRIQTPRQDPVTETRLPVWQRVAELFRGAAPAWGVASVILVALLVVSNLWWWTRSHTDEPMVTAGGMQIVAMAGTAGAADASGTLVISDDGEYGTLVVDGLPMLEAGQEYQLWLVRGDQATSGGLFTVNDEGYGALWIMSPEPLSSYPVFSITAEPAGGSPVPTGVQVLTASL